MDVLHIYKIEIQMLLEYNGNVYIDLFTQQGYASNGFKLVDEGRDKERYMERMPLERHHMDNIIFVGLQKEFKGQSEGGCRREVCLCSG